MPSRPGRSSRPPAADPHAENGTDNSTDHGADHGAHAETGAERQERAAGELSDRAADSVDRRYDATKEIHRDANE